MKCRDHTTPFRRRGWTLALLGGVTLSGGGCTLFDQETGAIAAGPDAGQLPASFFGPLASEAKVDEAERLFVNELANTAEMERLLQMAVIPLDDCLKVALQYNLDTRIKETQARAAETGVEKARAVFDPVWSGEVFDGMGDGNGSSGSALQLGKRFVTGTDLAIETGSRINDNLQISDELRDEDTGEIGVRLRQPLLKGAGIRYNQAGEERARLVAEAAGHEVVAQSLLTLRLAETTYWSAAVAKRNVAIQEGSVKRTTLIVEDVKQRRELGTATKLDYLETEGALARARESFVRAKKRYADEVDSLQFLLGIPLGQGAANWNFSEVTREFDDLAAPKPEEVYLSALDHAPEAILLANEVEQMKIELFRARRDLLPRLDVELNASRYSEASGAAATSTATSGTSSGSSSGGGSDNWEAIGLIRLSMPWGRRAQKADFARATAELQGSALAREQGLRRLQQSIYETTRRIGSGREELAVATHALAVQNEKWKEQLLRHREGVTPIRDLMEAENELRLAEITESQARLGLIAAWSNLYQLDGTIAERHGLAFVPPGQLAEDPES